MPLSLEPLGLTDLEGQVYLRLIEYGSATAQLVAEELETCLDDVVAALDQLTARGLIHREDFVGSRYRVISPDVALPELIRQRRLELNRLQDEADRIRDLLSARASTSCDVVERVVGTAAVLDAFTRLQRGARTEVLMVDAPPYFAGGVQPNESEFVALAAGVAYRVVYDREALATEGSRAAMREYVAAGEQARVNAHAGPKLIVADRRVALVLESATDPDPERRLLIRSSSVLDLLTSHFEQLWERSTPVEALVRGGAHGDASISDRDREVLTLLAAGLKDRAIARALGITERTVGRRVNELMRRLDADTRFRAGIRAVQRGWISE